MADISGDGGIILFAAWRKTTTGAYSSTWVKWSCWCNVDNGSMFISSCHFGFSALQFCEGKEYTTINLYHSAHISILSLCSKIMWPYPVKFQQYNFQRAFLRGLFLQVPIFWEAYTQRQFCISKSIGLAYRFSWKEIYVYYLRKGFTETRLEDIHVGLSKLQPRKYSVYLDQGCRSQE